MTVDQCKIVGSRGDGVDARGEGSSMLVKCTMIEDNGASGVSAQRQVCPALPPPHPSSLMIPAAAQCRGLLNNWRPPNAATLD